MAVVPTETRNATLEDLAALLKQQQDAKYDIVAPMAAMRSQGGLLQLAGTSMFEDGGGKYFRPTAIADGQIAGKLGIPTAYLRLLREKRIDLYDLNVNGWTQGPDRDGLALWAGEEETPPGPDGRSVMLRCFQNDEPDEPGVLRALLSDRYGIIENLDVLMAALQGIRDTGTPIEVLRCDLSETRMVVRIAAPEIMESSPELLAAWRAPFGPGGQDGGIIDHSSGRWTHVQQVPQWAQDKFGVDENGVCASLLLTNGETGGSRFTLAPSLLVLKCLNGWVQEQDALQRVHLTSKLEEGVIGWSQDTQRKSLELVTAQARTRSLLSSTPTTSRWRSLGCTTLTWPPSETRQRPSSLSLAR